MEKPQIIKKELNMNLNFMSDLKREDIKFLIIHHTGVSLDQRVETINNFHKNDRGWAGIGYHFYIRQNGSIYRGRPITKQGVHTSSVNSKSLAVCLAGNFNSNKPEEFPDQKEALIDLLAWLSHEFPNTTLEKNREFNNTSCPGDNFNIHQIREEVESRINEKKDLPNISRRINGKFDGEDFKGTAYLIESRVYIPVRVLEDYFDVTVSWNRETQEFQIDKR
ncbi:N-acetylmuramoyl-L-alanine amidase [Natranaerobius trueperi]|nr:N-acetylmuramoyl-L-alanine amidase [Natranaerobius trueperi]